MGIMVYSLLWVMQDFFINRSANSPLRAQESARSATSQFVRVLGCTHRLLSSSFLGLPCRILNTNHKKELLRSLWVIGGSGSVIRVIYGLGFGGRG